MRVSDLHEQWSTTGHEQGQVKKWQPHEAAKWNTEAGHVSPWFHV